MRDLPYQDLMLEAVGIGEAEETVYRSVIDRPGRTVREVAEATSRTQRDARRGLRFLEEKGLVTLAAGSPQRFMPAPPDVALEALVRQRQAELEQVRAVAINFAEQVRTNRDVASPLERVEVISGPQAITKRFDQLERQARREICILDKPPYVRKPNPVGLEQLTAGVKMRTIYEQEALALPGSMEHLDEFIDAGEESRVLLGLPTKLSLFDGTTALVPLYPVVMGGLVLHPSPLVDALVSMFEMLWERAVPIGTQEDATGDALTEREKDLLALLAAGQKDQVIARRLGVTTRTVQRLVSDLMKQLGVQTRYQAGLQAARRGWH